jgi:hypothetical protein
MNPVEQRIRLALLLLTGGLLMGTPVELLLAEHTEETQQKIPFILCGLGVFSIILVLMMPRPITLWLLRGVMSLLILGSALGMYYHLTGNFAFELEIRPEATHREVLMDALKGASPILAPGILAFGGAISWIASYGHPVLKQ